jgi:lipopolysaccharide transport system permease protein
VAPAVLIPLTGVAFLASFGAGLWLAALNVEYRDFRYVLPFIVQFGLYLSPVGYESNKIPEKWRLLYSTNPMVGVIDGFRWAITGRESFVYWQGLLVSLPPRVCDRRERPLVFPEDRTSICRRDLGAHV